MRRRWKMLVDWPHRSWRRYERAQWYHGFEFVALYIVMMTLLAWMMKHPSLLEKSYPPILNALINPAWLPWRTVFGCLILSGVFVFANLYTGSPDEAWIMFLINLPLSLVIICFRWWVGRDRENEDSEEFTGA